MVKYFIRTTKERTLDKSFSQIRYELLVDTEHNSGKAFVKQLNYIATLNCDAVIMEDDIILCNDFQNKIEETISQHTEDIINFFYFPRVYKDSGYETVFAYNQCTYIPKDKIPKILETLQDFESDRQEKIMKHYFETTQDKFWVQRPFLIQHIDNNSLMGHDRSIGTRRTLFFIDYLKELNMEYSEANTYENNCRLYQLLKDKFKDIDLSR